jgi:hypothetical protein
MIYLIILILSHKYYYYYIYLVKDSYWQREYCRAVSRVSSTAVECTPMLQYIFHFQGIIRQTAVALNVSFPFSEPPFSQFRQISVAHMLPSYLSFCVYLFCSRRTCLEQRNFFSYFCVFSVKLNWFLRNSCISNRPTCRWIWEKYIHICMIICSVKV